MEQKTLEFKGLKLEELKKHFVDQKTPGFRAVQLFDWVYKKGIEDPERMSNLPKNLRAEIKKEFDFNLLKKVKEVEASDKTVKFLWRMKDGKTIESVFLPYEDGRKSVCISTQVGCAVGCAFCITGELGWERNLTAGEIVDQVYRIEQWLKQKHPLDKKEHFRQLSNVVLMGMGEPLLNYEATIKAIRILTDPAGMDFSIRKITLSTVGIVPGIRKLAEEGLDIVLSISLHAPGNELRNTLIPVNKKYPLGELLKACEYYWEKTGRRITFEYAIIRDVNDRVEHVKQLAGLLQRFPAHVNLIPVNPGSQGKFLRPEEKKIKRFRDLLEREGIACTIRVERGTDIEAACGQLGKQARREGD